jgi:diguanylate cyclase (GGDEF)-like protein
MRHSRLAILGSAILLLILAIGGGVMGRANRLANQRAELTQQAAVESQLLNDYFQRVSALIDVTARNPSFVDYYALPGTLAQRARSTGRTMDQVVAALVYLGRMYPDRTGRAAFVDISGAENVRVVAGQQTPADRLSADVRRSAYFTGTFALPHGVVYQSRPYRSEELGEWVISSGAQIFMPNWVKQAMVHVEVPLESFRRQASSERYGQLLVVDGRTGQVVIDVSHPFPRGTAPALPVDRRFAARVAGWGTDGSYLLDGRLVVYHRIPAEVGNANNWFAVGVAPSRVTLVSSIGWIPTTLAAVALLAIAYAIAALRRAQRALVVAANTDPLTGLPNRRRLVADLDRLVPRATSERPVLLILSDLNMFKAYNDAFGHPEGDQLLIRLAASLSAALGARGTAYRMGGDEFCVLGQLDHAEIDTTIRAVATALRDDQRSVTITASHGAVTLSDGTTSPQDAIRLVDLRMYEHKRCRRATDRAGSGPDRPDPPTTEPDPQPGTHQHAPSGPAVPRQVASCEGDGEVAGQHRQPG